MADSDTSRATIVPGQLVEALRLLADAGIDATITFDDRSAIIDSPAKWDTLAAVELGGLRLRESLPTAVDRVHDGRIERHAYPDDDYGTTNHRGYWGRPDDLVAFGCAQRQRVTKGERWSKACGYGRSQWSAQFSPSGRVYYQTWDYGSAQSLENEQRAASLKEAVKRGEDIGIIRCDGHWYTAWTARRADLIGAGICGEQQFPISPKRQIHGTDDPRLEVESWSTEKITADCFEHVVRWTDDENKKRHASGIGCEPKVRPDGFSDAGRFAEICEDWMSRFAMVIESQIGGEIEKDTYGECTIRYDAATVEGVTAALDHARQLLQSATPLCVKRPGSHQANKARDDAGFRAFLARIPGLSTDRGN